MLAPFHLVQTPGLPFTYPSGPLCDTFSACTPSRGLQARSEIVRYTSSGRVNAAKPRVRILDKPSSLRGDIPTYHDGFGCCRDIQYQQTIFTRMHASLTVELMAMAKIDVPRRAGSGRLIVDCGIYRLYRNCLALRGAAPPFLTR